MSKCLVMTAQMLKDGTYDAHVYDNKTGTITIDPVKDKRIYVNKGKYNPQGGKERYDYLVNGLKLEGFMKNEDKEPSYLYTPEESRLFSYLGNKYVTGSFGEKVKPLFGSILVGKMFGQFKTYFNQMAENAFQPEKTINTAGWLKFEKDKDGKLGTRMITQYNYLMTVII